MKNTYSYIKEINLGQFTYKYGIRYHKGNISTIRTIRELWLNGKRIAKDNQVKIYGRKEI